MKLAEIQEENSRINLTFHTQDGVWIYLDGVKQAFLKPTQKFLLINIFDKNDFFDLLEKNNWFDSKRTVDYAEGLCEIKYKEQFDLVLNFINEKWKPNPELFKDITSHNHSRHIPGVVRNILLNEFEKEGRICPGVDGVIEKHNLTKNDKINFDHVLPYSKGGSNEWRNVQILCSNCNNKKRATAL
jgi:hypothetical protein